jgi:4-hydroxybenzoate polyprenyltransferase
VAQVEDNPPCGAPEGTSQTRVAPNKGLRSWLQLIRLPNLFTVPGDALAGFLLAGWASSRVELPWLAAVGAALGVLCAYCAGLIHNDISDLEEDRRQRPSRPLPSGRITLPAATGLFTLFIFAGILVVHYFAGAAGIGTGKKPMLIYGLLIGMILIYNRLAKKAAILGPLCMGLCRGLGMMLGAAALVVGDSWGAALSPLVLAGAGGLVLYIMAVTTMAAGETGQTRLGASRFAPFLLNLLWLATVYATILSPRLTAAQFHPDQLGALLAQRLAIIGYPAAIISLAAAILSLGRSLVIGATLGPSPAPARVQKSVGAAIRNLLPIQAALAATCGDQGMYVAIALLVLWPVSALVARKFYGS